MKPANHARNKKTMMTKGLGIPTGNRVQFGGPVAPMGNPGTANLAQQQSLPTTPPNFFAKKKMM